MATCPTQKPWKSVWIGYPNGLHGGICQWAFSPFPHFVIHWTIRWWTLNLPTFWGGGGGGSIFQQPTFVPLGSIFNLPSFRPDIRAYIVILFGKQIVKMWHPFLKKGIICHKFPLLSWNVLPNSDKNLDFFRRVLSHLCVLAFMSFLEITDNSNRPKGKWTMNIDSSHQTQVETTSPTQRE